jgi:hypothetical protein
MTQLLADGPVHNLEGGVGEFEASLGGCPNCSRIMAATPGVVMGVTGGPGCLDLACGEELRRGRLCRARRIESQNLARATRRASGNAGKVRSYQHGQ